MTTYINHGNFPLVYHKTPLKYQYILTLVFSEMTNFTTDITSEITTEHTHLSL